MSYDYQTVRPTLFAEDGIKLLLDVRDKANALLAEAGAFTASKCWSGIKLGAYDSWTAIAALDFLIEREELMCITPDWAGQDKIYTRKWNR